jgi:hypothetical protein
MKKCILAVVLALTVIGGAVVTGVFADTPAVACQDNNC